MYYARDGEVNSKIILRRNTVVLCVCMCLTKIENKNKCWDIYADTQDGRKHKKFS